MHDDTDIRTQLDRERHIIGAATEGPWHVTDRGTGWEVSREPLEDKPDDPGHWPATVNDGFRGTFSQTDAAFIVHARTALPVRNAQVEAVLDTLKAFEHAASLDNDTSLAIRLTTAEIRRAIEEAGK